MFNCSTVVDVFVPLWSKDFKLYYLTNSTKSIATVYILCQRIKLSLINIYFIIQYLQFIINFYNRYMYHVVSLGMKFATVT